MQRKPSVLGIVSILFSIPFYIIVRLLYTTDRLDSFFSQNFPYAFPLIFLALPGLIIGLAISALRQADRNKLFAYLAGVISVPVIIITLIRTAITIAYISIISFSR